MVVECPTNPLVQICDLPRVSAAVRECGGVLLVDPTVASIYNVDVLPYADLVVCSLTKYAANEGDVMIGSLALNADSPYYAELASRVVEFHVSPYGRDLQRLAYEMQGAAEIVAGMNLNASRLAEFLRSIWGRGGVLRGGIAALCRCRARGFVWWCDDFNRIDRLDGALLR